MNLTKQLKVAPGSQVKLASIDPSFHGKWKDADDAKAELDRNLSRITTLQRKLYADRRHSLLVVLQGIDSAGKDGTCWHVISAMHNGLRSSCCAQTLAPGDRFPPGRFRSSYSVRGSPHRPKESRTSGSTA